MKILLFCLAITLAAPLNGFCHRLNQVLPSARGQGPLSRKRSIQEARLRDAHELPVFRAEDLGLSGSVREVKTDEVIKTFGRSGRLIDEAHYDKGSMTFVVRYFYYTDGNLAQRKVQNPDGSVDSRQTYLYDDRGLLLESSDCRKAIIEGGVPGGVPGAEPTPPAPKPDGPFCDFYRYVFANDGLLVQKVMYKSNYSALSKTIYEYNNQNRLTIQTNYQQTASETWSQTFRFAYDDKGNLARIESYPLFGNKNEPVSTHTRRYDEHGLLAAEDWHDSWGSQSSDSYEYEYDSRGNWIRQSALHIAKTRNESTPQTDRRITKRAIEYYPATIGVQQDLYPEVWHQDKEIYTRPEARYPAIAKSAHITGDVTVRVTIDEKGAVTEAVAVSGHPLLREAAVDSAKKCTFKPAIFDGSPTKVAGQVTFHFTM